MENIPRTILPQVQRILQRGKSVLLLGPRQTGKTTLITEYIRPDIIISFAEIEKKLRYEKDPAQFEKDLVYQIKLLNKIPLVFIDEVQKIPSVMDGIQYLIDKKQAQFVLSGSSARKLKHGSHVNLLPGRVVSVTMDSLSYSELPLQERKLENLLLFGSLPGMITEQDLLMRETDLSNYVMTYLEEEIRQEALVRNVGAFSRFLELAAIESGNLINFTRISQDVGVSDQTIREYFQILEDCLIASKISPMAKTSSRRVLSQAPKYLFFDLGVRRFAAHEGRVASIKQRANWFEQYIGCELLRLIHIFQPLYKLRYWRDANNIEVDYVIDTGDSYIPIEIKWNESPKEKDARHLNKFINEYNLCKKAYIVCRTATPYQLSESIDVISWQQLEDIFINNNIS